MITMLSLLPPLSELLVWTADRGHRILKWMLRNIPYINMLITNQWHPSMNT